MGLDAPAVCEQQLSKPVGLMVGFRPPHGLRMFSSYPDVLV